MASSRALPAILGVVGNPIGDIYSLDDEMVKLVAYTIVSIKRDEEKVMEGEQSEGSIVVTDRMSGEAFAAWMIANYMQAELATIDQKRKNAPDDKEKRAIEEQLKELEKERKYLRVYFVVSTRWPREPKKFEEREVEVLREIKEKLA